MNELTRASLAELVGTFILVLVGAGAVASEQGVLVAAMAHGIVLVSIVYTYGHISGAHVNPAVTLALLVGNKIKIERAAYYWVAQFLGGIIAAFVLDILVADVIGASFNNGQTTGSLTADRVWNAAVLEAIMTFFLASTVYQAAGLGKAGKFAGIAIGFTLLASITLGGTFTGASLNPSRTLGPALAAGESGYLIPYLIGIFAGGALAGVVQSRVFAPGEGEA